MNHPCITGCTELRRQVGAHVSGCRSACQKQQETGGNPREQALSPALRAGPRVATNPCIPGGPDLVSPALGLVSPRPRVGQRDEGRKSRVGGRYDSGRAPFEGAV